jgi:hypothetical protein
MAHSTLARILLVLIVFVLLTILFDQGSLMSFFMTDEQICRVTAAGGDKIRFVGKSLMLADCKSRLVQVFDDSVTIDGSRSAVYIDGQRVANYGDIFEERRDEIISDIIAQELYRCHDMLEKGTINPYHNFFTGMRFAGVICSRITFSEEVSEGGEISGLIQYLIDTKVPLRDETYGERFLFAVEGYLSDEDGESQKKISTTWKNIEAIIRYNKVGDGEDHEVIIPFLVPLEEPEEKLMAETLTFDRDVLIDPSQDYYIMMTFASPRYRVWLLRWFVHGAWEGFNMDTWRSQAKQFDIYGYLTIVPVESAAKLDALLN